MNLPMTQMCLDRKASAFSLCMTIVIGTNYDINVVAHVVGFACTREMKSFVN